MTQEIINIIETLNEELYNQIGDSLYNLPMVMFEYGYDGYCHYVKLFGSIIWDSDNDYRKYINEGTPQEDYEPLEDFIRREVNNIIKVIKVIKQ